jgi:hypothetical protein
MKWHEVAQVRRISECCRDGDGTVFKLSFTAITVALQMARERQSELFCVMFMREHFLRSVSYAAKCITDTVISYIA